MFENVDCHSENFRNKNGTFSHGNSAWTLRNRHGAKQRFEDCEALIAAAVKYFEWVEDNPLYRHQAFSYAGKISIVAVPRLRAMSLKGLCLHIGISHRQWNAWKKQGGRFFRADLLPVIKWVEQIIWAQKFEGAAAGLFNQRIVSHELRWKG